ncbi:hypothetical protein HAV15_003267 [Penicillium sp. str. |nr:hypothetical protein HAV15_003267 [Penicillium sp. str. \
MYPDSDCVNFNGNFCRPSRLISLLPWFWEAPPLVFILSLTNATERTPSRVSPAPDSASTSDSSIGTGTRSSAASALFRALPTRFSHSGFHNHFRPSSGVETHYIIFK